MTQKWQWCKFFFLQNPFLPPCITLAGPMDLTHDQVPSVPLFASVSWVRSSGTFLNPCLSRLLSCCVCLNRDSTILCPAQHSRSPCAYIPAISPATRRLNFPHTTDSLHPVKLLGFLLSCLLVQSLEDFSLPFLLSLPSSHIQLLLHPSNTSLPSPRLPPCGPAGHGEL